MSSMIEAKVLADSLNVVTGDRLTTFQVRVPKFLLAEINTHRALSRNAASSRAIPAKMVRHQVLKDPFIPIHFGANQKGMQANSELTGWRLELDRKLHLWGRYPACFIHWIRSEIIGAHKQNVNRNLESWMWADGVISATEWKNFFKLRNHPDAQPEFRQLAHLMHHAYFISTPKEVKPGEWHLPFIPDGVRSLQMFGTIESLKRTSTARCARVSYLLRDGKLSTPTQDLQLCDRLFGSDPMHLSPAEHIAQALPASERVGNFVGWKQFRKEIDGESGGDYMKSEISHAAN